MSDLHEATSAVISFLDEEADNRSAAGSDMSDYAREPRDLAERLGGALEAAEAMVTALLAERGRLEEENRDLQLSVITFCSLWAVTYARDRGLPEGHLFPTHYDILEKAGGRMVDFVRAVQAQGEAQG